MTAGNSHALITELAGLQLRLLELTAPLSQAQLYRQAHPELSPLAWHLGHCVFIESYWLHEQVLGSSGATGDWGELYFPDRSVKADRGRALPARRQLFDWVQGLQQENRELLADLLAGDATRPRPERHPLLHDNYLPRFLCQHHAQHLETMHMALAQQALAGHHPPGSVPALHATGIGADTVCLRPGDYRIGQDGAVFDNEQPAGTVSLAGCRLGTRPVSNGEYLGFIEAGAYSADACWSAAGRQWRIAEGAHAPALWQRQGGNWYQVGPHGPRPLPVDAAVSGLSGFEAEAYAAWAGGRLPHEYEWEAAARKGLLQGVGEVWEWCGNTFHPYPGFRPFPYDAYSLPWFDGEHYVLRGSGRHSEDCIRRPSFRNFYRRNQRHIFAGCRLAYDA